MADDFNTEAFTLLGVGIVVVAARTASRLTIAGISGLWAEYVAQQASMICTGTDTTS